MNELRLLFVGFGKVAQGCAGHLVRSCRYLEQEHNFRYKVVAINDPDTCSAEDYDRGIDLAEVLRLAASGKKLRTSSRAAIETIKSGKADILIESTWTNLEDAEPGLSHIKAALQNGLDVVTSNKGPIALAYNQLKRLAKANGRHLRFESTVMSGTPFFSMCESGLAGARISGMRGILNGTTNYILTEMAGGKSYGEALARAQELGYAEADPSGDIEARDPAAKITILANTLLGAEVRYADVERAGISSITLDELERASRESKSIKLIARAFRRPDGEVAASVKPTLVDHTDLLAHVGGIMNALQVSMNVQPDVTVIGPGAGGDSAGYGLLNDILTIHRSRSRHSGIAHAAS